MKIIDLLNKIANGEELPKTILYSDKIWYWDTKENDYVEDYKRLFNYYLDECLISCLNEEVEIIEEDKKIEKLELVNNGNVNAYALLDDWGTKCALTKHSKIMVDKINEIIDVINKGDN